MKIIVTGAKGQLGTDLVNLLSGFQDMEVIGYGREELDITNQEMVDQLFQSTRPDIVIHAAAHTAVDQAESEPDKAYLINAIGSRNVAVAAEKQHAKLVYVSTDYVFDGTANSPINEFQPTSPLGVYGKSKLAGEQFVRDFHSRHFVVRTSWVFGKQGNNFVKTMLKLAREKNQLSVVHDQIGSPTYTVDLAKKIIEIMHTDKYGTYHISNSGHCSWFEFARAIFDEANVSVEVQACETKDFPRPAPRPAYSVFDHMSLRLNGFGEMRGWREALKAFLKTE